MRLRHWLCGTIAAAASGCALAPVPTDLGEGIATVAAIEPLRLDRPVIGLALGSGGKRGFAHIGVLKALEAAGIKPDLIVGTSAGSMVGALFASGLSAGEIERIAEGIESPLLGRAVIPGRGLLSSEPIQSFVNRHVGNRRIEELAIPFAAVATDAQSGAETVFNRGNTGMAVRASSSVPVFFQPVTIGGREYVDGTLVSPVPVGVARRMGADVVIAVNVAYTPREAALRDPIDMLFQTMQIMATTINRLRLRQADVVIEPDIAGMGKVTFADKRALIALGEHAARQMLPELRARILGLAP